MALPLTGGVAVGWGREVWSEVPALSSNKVPLARARPQSEVFLSGEPAGQEKPGLVSETVHHRQRSCASGRAGRGSLGGWLSSVLLVCHWSLVKERFPPSATELALSSPPPPPTQCVSWRWDVKMQS